MIETRKIMVCDLCHAREEISVMAIRPEGWRIRSVAGVNRPEEYHICPDCRGQLERMRLIELQPWAMSVSPISVMEAQQPSKL